MATATEVELLPKAVDEVAPSRRREATMASAILHMMFVMLVLTNPTFLRLLGPQPLSPELAQELAAGRLTLLYLPSELLKVPTPRKEELTPEERRRAVIRTPFTVDPQELRRVLPLPVPAEPTERRPPGPLAESSAAGGEKERAKRREQALEERRSQVARLENVPEPGSQTPKIELPAGTAGRAIEESLRAGVRGSGQTSEPGGGGLPVVPNLNTPFPMILSDTRGVDFGPYLTRLYYDVRKNWYAVIPEAARLGRKGRVIIVFSIRKDGSVPRGEPELVRPSDFLPYDRAALGAIRGAQPFPPLPEEFTGEEIVLQFTFLYNLPLDYHEP